MSGAVISKYAVSMDRTHLANGAEMAPCVYRFYALDGTLLYIGLSMAVLNRLHQHKRLPWYREIAEIKLEHKDSREAAFLAEKAAIRAERPKYNLYETGEYEYAGVKGYHRRKREQKEAANGGK